MVVFDRGADTGSQGRRAALALRGTKPAWVHVSHRSRGFTHLAYVAAFHSVCHVGGEALPIEALAYRLYGLIFAQVARQRYFVEYVEYVPY